MDQGTISDVAVNHDRHGHIIAARKLAQSSPHTLRAYSQSMADLILVAAENYVFFAVFNGRSAGKPCGRNFNRRVHVPECPREGPWEDRHQSGKGGIFDRLKGINHSGVVATIYAREGGFRRRGSQ